MSKNDEPTNAGLIAHYMHCTHTLACARKDFEPALTAALQQPVGVGGSTVSAAAALDEALTNVAKLVSALALSEMPRQTQVTS